MYESATDLDNLQSLLDASIEQAGSFLRDAMEIDRRTLSARQIVNLLDGLRTVSLASVTARGEPRVAPITAMFVQGRYYIPTVKSAARSQHLRKRPATSLAEYDGNDHAIIIHGQAALIDSGHPDFTRIDEMFTRLTTEIGPGEWGGGGPVYVRVDPAVMYATALEPERYPA